MPSAPVPDPIPCPGCGRPAAGATSPFCSQGCRDRDLLQWLTAGHRLPGPPAELDESAGDGLDSGAAAPL